MCRNCFCTSVEDRVRAAIAKYEMLKFDDKLLVAVSGGKDSVGLLHALARIEKNFPKATLLAVSIDEGIKGYRDEALQIAAENCSFLSVEHHVSSFKELFGLSLDEIVQKAEKILNSERLSTCAYCGVLRRRALDLAAKQLNADVLALGHNLDDVVQTFLLNVVHGDVDRLARFGAVSAKSDVFVRRVRPFCLVPERETAFYAYLRGIRFQSVVCPYAGDALRNDVRFWLNRLEQRHSGSLFTVLRSFEKIKTLMPLKEKEFYVCKKCGDPCTEGRDVCMVCDFLEKLGVLC
ncbi:MAG: TIGR00269 family protein [Candidatus Bathyarchaeales archaeon]